MSDTRLTSDRWPIAAAMLPFPASQDAPADTWVDHLAQVAYEGFTEVDLTDSWIQPGDLSPARIEELREALTTVGLDPIALSAIRRSVIDPETGDENLAYSHRTIDAAAALGTKIVSVGLHRPLLPAQREAFWFWTEEGPVDPTDADTWALAVSRLRELGRHGAEVGVQLSLEMYEDTLLGTAESSVRLVHDIGEDNVGLNPDIGNLVRLHRPIEDWREMHEKTLPYANYWHVKNYTRDEAVDGSWYTSTPTSMELGLINYRAMVARAIELGFSGPFLMEQYGGDSLGVCATNRRYLQSLLPEPAGA